MLTSIALLLLCVAPALAGEKLTYLVEYSTTRAGHIHVVIQPSKPVGGPVTLVIPRAIPSGYAQQYYDRYVENVRAGSAAGTPVRIEREDGPRWRVGAAGDDVARIEYDVNVARLEREIPDAADTSKTRAEYVGLLGYSVLGYLEGSENIPIRLEVHGPEGWPVFTTLAPKTPIDTAKTAGEAANFYRLADSQIAMGPKVQVRKLDTSVPAFFLLYTEVHSDGSRQGETFAEAFRTVLAYFGDAPFTHYTAYVEILKPLSDRHQYGFSMEHVESSTYFLGADRAITTGTTPEHLNRDRFNFAHHVAHSWIPKQVYGVGYLPFSWELAPQIDTIWFNEGFARYVAIEALADAMDEAQGLAFRKLQLGVLRRLLADIPEFIRSMPLRELSRTASSMYSADFRTGRTLFSKGALMAAEMDDTIRQRTHGAKRLRDSLRALVKWGRQSGRPFRIDELPRLIATPVGVAEQEIKAILDRWLSAPKN